MYKLNEEEENRLISAVQTAFAIPFIDDLEDYVWEALFAYVKNIPLTDTINNIRSKRLFDIVDDDKKIGWSAKTLVWNIRPNAEFELVIQRADIFKKHKALGFENLTIDSPPQMLGKALTKHWYSKVALDAEFQGVKDKRICFLLKSRQRKKFAYYEENLLEHTDESLEWKWTDDTKTGLQGRSREDGFCVFRWYPNQKQLFERFVLPESAFTFELEPRRLIIADVVKSITETLNKL